MNEPTTVTYSIAEVLKRIEDKLDKIDEKFEDKLDKIDEKFEDKLDKIDEKFEDKLDKIDENFKDKLDKIDKKFEDKLDTLQKDVNTKLEKLNTIEVKLTAIDTEVKNLNQDVTELKGSTKAQIWTLIGILVTAVSGFLVAVARFVFYPLT